MSPARSRVVARCGRSAGAVAVCALVGCVSCPLWELGGGEGPADGGVGCRMSSSKYIIIIIIIDIRAHALALVLGLFNSPFLLDSIVDRS